MNLYHIKRFFRNHYLAFASFLLIFLVTVFFYKETRQRIKLRNEKFFESRTAQAKQTIEKRITHYIQILKGAKGLFIASDTITRRDWKEYVNTLEVELNYPGIQGIGFSAFIRPEELDSHIQKIRAEGFPDYTVRPQGERDIYTSIIYLEPFEGRNLRAFGFDMFSEPVRQKAMARAMDTNQPAMTGKVRLVQESTQDEQAGFLIYLPVYRKGVSLQTVEERRKNIIGFVYNPFRAADLMNATLLRSYSDLHIEVYDGNDISKETLLYSKDTTGGYFGDSTPDHLTKIETISIGGHNWQIYFASMPDFGEISENQLPAIILIGGSLISLLISFIMWSLSNTRRSDLIKQSITDNASAALFILNRKGYCTFMNPAAAEMTGFSLNEIQQKPLHDMIHYAQPDGKPYPRSECPIIKALSRNSNMRDYEDIFFRKDGSQFYASCSSRPIFDINAPGSALIELRDISGIKEAERKIKENSILLNKIFMEVPAIVGLIRAPDQRYVLANTQLSQLFGNRELLGKTFREAHPELEAQGFFDVMDSVFRTGKSYIGKEVLAIVNRNNNGQTSQDFQGFFNVVYQPIVNSSQEVESVLIFAIDVTELVLNRRQILEINDELSLKNKKLIQINNDLDNFVYTASHDLKAPIANLEGLTLLMQRRLVIQPDSTEQQVLDMVVASVNKLKQTISDLTEITKVQKDLQENIEPLDFNEILENIKADIAPLINDSEASIQTDFKVKKMFYARKNLRSIIYNLVSNAIKYRHPDRPAIVKIRTFEQQGQVVLQVEDNGLGINPDQKHKLFSMFKRLHTHVEGTGIGLYIVKRIIENNGGRIDVDSEPEKGSIFSVYFSDEE
jgi:PAS domain S-box-containing protein